MASPPHDFRRNDFGPRKIEALHALARDLRSSPMSGPLGVYPELGPQAPLPTVLPAQNTLCLVWRFWWPEF